MRPALPPGCGKPHQTPAGGPSDARAARWERGRHRRTGARRERDMIEAHGLTKRYGDKVAVDDLSFTVQPGRVTGFLGPNGAGKSTTMRMILGLDRPHAGDATIGGRHYPDLP